MSDDTQHVATADLKPVLRNTEKSARDAQAALEATEPGRRHRPRFTSIEARLTGLEQRLASVETGIDGVARSNHRIEQMLSDVLARQSPP
jgi:hypothetical protein